jgi:coenzyme Q-binding protein COQ10
VPSFATTRRVRHRAADMFDLVADVEQYPAFVPLCERLVVKKREIFGEGHAVLVADMTVAYKIFRDTFTSRVRLDRPALAIFVEYLDGPFSSLENRWRFAPTGETTCDSEFFIDYEFRSRALGVMMGSVFETAFKRFALAFEKRADEIYGAPSVATA